MVRLWRCVTWCVIYIILAGLTIVIAMPLAEGWSQISIGVGLYLALMVIAGLIGSSPALVAISWLVTGNRGTPWIVMIILGSLFAAVSLPMAKLLGVVGGALGTEQLMPAILIGAIVGLIAEMISRPLNRSFEAPANKGSRFFAFLRESGEPTATSRALVIAASVALTILLWQTQVAPT